MIEFKQTTANIFSDWLLSYNNMIIHIDSFYTSLTSYQPRIDNINKIDINTITPTVNQITANNIIINTNIQNELLTIANIETDITNLNIITLNINTNSPLLENDIILAESYIPNIKTDIQKLITYGVGTDYRLDYSEKTNKTLTDDTTLYTTLINNINTDLLTLQTNATTTSTDLSNLNIDSINALNISQQHNLDITILTNNLQQLYTDIIILKNKTNNLETEFNQIDDIDFTTLYSDIDYNKNNIQIISDKIDTLTNDINSYNLLNNALNTDTNTILIANSDLEAKNNTYTSSLIYDITTLRNNLSIIDSNIDLLININNTLKSLISSNDNDIKTLSDKIDQINNILINDKKLVYILNELKDIQKTATLNLQTTNLITQQQNLINNKVTEINNTLLYSNKLIDWSDFKVTRISDTELDLQINILNLGQFNPLNIDLYYRVANSNNPFVLKIANTISTPNTYKFNIIGLNRLTEYDFQIKLYYGVLLQEETYVINGITT